MNPTSALDHYDLPPIRPYAIYPTIEVHTFHLPMYRRVADALRRVLISFCGPEARPQ